MRKANLSKISLFIVLGTLAAAGLVRTAAAQAPPPSHYSPPNGRPTVSPYLNLFRGNSGPVPNYQTLVRPQLNQLETNRMLRLDVERNAGHIQQVEQNVATLRDPKIAPTGAGGSFYSYSHFYSQAQGPR